MSQGKKVDMTVPIGSVEQAVAEGDWALARRLMALRMARMFDSSDSIRDVKAVGITLDPLIDKCEMDAKSSDEERETPLDRIMEMAANA